MNAFLTHVDLGPIVYGVIMFLGLWIMWWKLATGRFFSVFIDVAVFYLVFKLHGGTMAGGFSAMVAAMLAGLVFPLVFRRS